MYNIECDDVRVSFSFLPKGGGGGGGKRDGMEEILDVYLQCMFTYATFVCVL